MATLQGAITELVTVIGSVEGIARVPDTPTEQVSSYPYAAVYASDGNLAQLRTSNEEKSLHTIQIAVLMPFISYQICFRKMLPLYEPIVAALITHLNGRSSDHYATWGLLEYTLGPLEWDSPDVPMFGYLFVLSGVKIRNEV